MVNVLSRGLAERLRFMDFTIGRKGLLNYIKALAGSNIVKIVPASNGSAGGERTNGDKRLKVVCGAFQSYLDDEAWIGENTPYVFAEVRFSPANTLTPNIGSLELAEAINRVLPFASTDDARPVLGCVMFVAGGGKLKLIGADGFRLAECVLDFDTSTYTAEVKVLVNRADLKGIPSVLRKAKRVRLHLDKAGDTLDGMALLIDTEVARYKFVSAEGQFPDYEKVIPSEFTCTAHLDTQEALKAIHALKATADNPRDYQIDLTIGGGQMIMANPDEKGEVVVKADSGDGEAYIRINGEYLASAMRACGGMVDFNLSKSYSPVLFGSEGFMVVIMPVMSQKANEQHREDTEGKEAEATAEQSEPEATAEQPKRRRSRRRQPVAVA